VLESIVFLVQTILDEMSTVLPAPASLRVSGGLSHLDGLCRRLADLSKLPVERADDPEATARGLAWLVHGDTVASIDASASSSPAKFSSQRAVVFEPRTDPALAARFARFRQEIEDVTRG
jgi:glycerol kinase